MPFLVYLPWILWSGLVAAAQERGAGRIRAKGRTETAPR